MTTPVSLWIFQDGKSQIPTGKKYRARPVLLTPNRIKAMISKYKMRLEKLVSSVIHQGRKKK